MIIWRSLISPTEVDNTKLFILDGETWVFAEKGNTASLLNLSFRMSCNFIDTLIQARAQTFWGAGAQTKKKGTHRQNDIDCCN